VGDRIPNEDAYLLAKFFREGMKSDWLQAYPHVGGVQVAQRYGVASGTNLGALDPSNSVVVIAGADLKEEAPLWYLRLRNRVRVFQVSGSKFQTANLQPATRNLQLECQEGTETLAVLGLLNVVIAEGLVKESVAARVDGLEELWAGVAAYAPDEVSRLTGVPADAIVATARALAEAENAILVFGTMGAPESLARHMANLAILTGHVGRPNNGVLPVWPHANTQGVLDQIQPSTFSLQPSIVYILGADPVGDGEWLPEDSFVICHELFLTETARKADVILPALSWAERDGTFTSAERRVQRFYRVLPPLGQAQPDWEIVCRVARKLGLDWNYASSEEIMEELVARMPRYAGMTYARLAQTEEQWPPVGGSDLYFGGTAYDNRGGLGAQLPAECETLERYEVQWIEPEVRPIKRRHLYQRGTLISKSERLEAHCVE